jgi:MoxR-like ATPase
MDAQLNPDPINADSISKIPLLIENMESVIKGKRMQIEFVITCLLAKGHILMEDNPGTGKTVLARTLAHSVSSENNGENVFKRIQFTPDLLPMDLIGTHVFDEQSKDFIFRKGPLFCNVLLADEINRASPKVQSALLECMAEGQISVGDTTILLDKLFFTIATQNPVEMEGTYPLPAAQLDRFFMKMFFGYVDEETELDIYRNYLQIQDNLTHLHQVLSRQEVLELQAEAEKVFVHEEILKAVSNIVRATRDHADITLGASTRAGISFLRCLRSFALVKGRSFVIEDDIQTLAFPVLDHRLIYRNKEAKAKSLTRIIQIEMERLNKLK